MGAGLAKNFAKHYPEMIKPYAQACKSGKLLPGGIFVYNTGNQFIVNLATKDDWRNSSKYEYIQEGLYNLKNWLDNISDIKRVAIPALRMSVFGNLKFNKVKKMIGISVKHQFKDLIINSLPSFAGAILIWLIGYYLPFNKIVALIIQICFGIILFYFYFEKTQLPVYLKTKEIIFKMINK